MYGIVKKKKTKHSWVSHGPGIDHCACHDTRNMLLEQSPGDRKLSEAERDNWISNNMDPEISIMLNWFAMPPIPQ